MICEDERSARDLVRRASAEGADVRAYFEIESGLWFVEFHGAMSAEAFLVARRTSERISLQGDAS